MSKQKVWVNEMPKGCWDCPCFDSYELQCQINYADCENLDIVIERHKDCLLQSVKDHDRELVKQVCEKIRKKVDNISMHTATKERLMLMCKEIEKEYEK